MLIKDSNNCEATATLRTVPTPLNSKTSKRQVKRSLAPAVEAPKPPSPDSSFAEAEIVWAKRDDNQYWPGIVCQHHKNKVVQDGNKIHVQFFGDPPIRSWIDKSFVKPFTSGKSTNKLKDVNWENGCRAADKALALTTKDRLQLITCPVPSDDVNVNQQSEKSTLNFGRKKGSRAPQPKRRKVLFDESNSDDGGLSKSQDEETRNFPHLTLDWLQPDKIKDGNGRSPQNLDYNSHTLFVPKEFIQNLTPLMRQWWAIKSNHCDAVLFFKVGNFYDLYHMDALLASKELGLTLLKGDHAHCRFSEGGDPDRFSKYSQLLVDKGFKVARVEQTETPEMCYDRVKKTPGATKFDKVIQRELCQITSIGTRTCSVLEGDNWQEESNFLMAIWEKCGTEVSTGSRSLEFGVAFVDTSVGHFHLGQFKDDRYRSRLSTLITRFRVVEMISARRFISAETLRIISTACPSVLQEKLSPNADCWDTGKTLKSLAEKDYFKIDNKMVWPEALKSLLGGSGSTVNLVPAEEAELAVKALGALYWYLKECKLDQELFSRRSFQIYRPLDSEEKDIQVLTGTHLVLDGMTLRNLDVLSNSSTGSLRGSLLGLLNGCSTAFGQRKMRHWICAPLCQPELIEDRLNAVQFLSSDPNLLKEIERMLKSLPDLERLVNTIHGQGSSLRARNHPDGRAVFGPSIQKRKVSTFLQTLAGFRRATRLLSLSRLLDYKHHGSDLLKKSVLRKEQGGEFPDMGPQLDLIVKAFNVPEAVNKGKMIPCPGFNSEYDDALEIIASIESEAEEYLMKQKANFRCKVTYVGTESKRFHLEFHHSSDLPTSEEYTKDGLFIYWTKETNAFQQRLSFAQALCDNAIKENARRVFEHFNQYRPMWEKAVECLSNLDVLSTLAAYANQTDHKMCRPKLVRPSSDQQPFLRMIQGRHPAHSVLFVNNDFISNDVSIGLDDQHSLTLVTGPNMGGKSTLMRQVGLCIILAQMGSYVPCEKFELTPVDRLFTRLGASDRILDGESTFFVELSETAAILQNSTINSFVLIDEFGRGTSTFDGTAMAYSVIDNLVNRRCRTLFSTHYHSLVKDFMGRPEVKLGHMASMADEKDEEAEDPSQESIVFLYRFVDGACPKSYGFHAAKLAGLPRSIISKGYKRARDMEMEVGQKQAFKDLFKNESSPSKVNWQHIGI